MNELRIIENITAPVGRDVRQAREYRLGQIKDFDDMENFVIDNVIFSNAIEESEFEEDDLLRIVEETIQYGWDITVENLSGAIDEHNHSIIAMATSQLRVRMGDERWVNKMLEEYNLERTIEENPRLSLPDAVTLGVETELEEMVYTGMYETYFQKIFRFCKRHELELHVSEEYEIFDLLYYAKILGDHSWSSPVLMAGIKNAILCPALTGVMRGRVFVMGNTLYMPGDTFGWTGETGGINQ